MFSIILTWIGAVLGLGMLVAMALGAFVVDLDDAFESTHGTTSELPENSSKTVAPLG